MSQQPPNYSPAYQSPRPAPPANDAVSTLIPYRNAPALISYYLGIFSLFPILGAFLGVAAVILGIKGLAVAKANPNAKGAVHAWVGIVCGGIFGLIWIALIILTVVAFIAAPRSTV